MSMANAIRQHGQNKQYTVNIDGYRTRLPGLPQEPNAKGVIALANQFSKDWFRVSTPPDALDDAGRAKGRGTAQLQGKVIATEIAEVAGIVPQAAKLDKPAKSETAVKET